MDPNEVQMLTGIVNCNARLLRQCHDLVTQGNEISDIAAMESRTHDLISSFRRLAGVFRALHRKESEDYNNVRYAESIADPHKSKCMQNSINILDRLTHFLDHWDAQLECLKSEIGEARASKRRRICDMGVSHFDGDGSMVARESIKVRSVECMILKRILSTLGW